MASMVHLSQVVFSPLASGLAWVTVLTTSGGAMTVAPGLLN